MRLHIKGWCTVVKINHGFESSYYISLSFLIRVLVPVAHRMRFILKSPWSKSETFYLLHIQDTLPPLLLLLSADLDTSEDFSAELDLSHGFFTASREGERIDGIK